MIEYPGQHKADDRGDDGADDHVDQALDAGGTSHVNVAGQAEQAQAAHRVAADTHHADEGTADCTADAGMPRESNNLIFTPSVYYVT